MSEPNAELRIFADTPFPVIAVDAALRVVEWNARAAALFGVDRAAALGRDVGGLVPVEGGWRELLAGDGATPRARSVGGRRCEWQHQPLAGGGALVFVREVGACAEARRNELLLRAIVDNLNIIVWAIDPDGTFRFQEGKGLAAAGLRPRQFLGQNLFELYAQSPEGLAPVRRALAGEAVHSSSHVHGIDWENWQIPVRGDDGRVEALVGVTFDVSEVKRAEHELRGKLDLIERQQRVIRELSTPIIEVWDRVLTLPMIGLVDSVRTAEIMDNLLEAVGRTRARFAVLDLTGVETLDTATASHLVGMIRAIRLLGAEGIITGIQPTVAQTIVTLGMDLSSFVVHADLRSALKYCFARLGVSPDVRSRPEPPAGRP